MKKNIKVSIEAFLRILLKEFVESGEKGSPQEWLKISKVKGKSNLIEIGLATNGHIYESATYDLSSRECKVLPRLWEVHIKSSIKKKEPEKDLFSQEQWEKEKGCHEAISIT